VQDNASFFSRDAVARADGLIRDIRAIDQRDVLIVTYPAIPDDRQAGYKAESKQTFFAAWAEEIGKQNGVSGIVILLTQEPAHLEIVVGNKTRQHSFTLDDRDQLATKMLALLKEKKNDDALLDGLAFVKEKMKRANAPVGVGAQNTPPPYANSNGFPTPSVPSTGFPVGGLICAGVAVLIVVFIIMAVANRNRGEAAAASDAVSSADSLAARSAPGAMKNLTSPETPATPRPRPQAATSDHPPTKPIPAIQAPAVTSDHPPTLEVPAETSAPAAPTPAAAATSAAAEISAAEATPAAPAAISSPTI
jgi:hypothetical protein